MENQLESGFQGGYFKSHSITGGYFSMATIYAYVGINFMVMDVPNTFVHTSIPPKKYG